MSHHFEGIVMILVGIALILGALFLFIKSDVQKEPRWHGWPARLGGAACIGCALALLFNGYQYTRLP
jgi:hypothetical protein